MKSDVQLRYDVLSQLQLEARINPAELGVAVENGVVTLKGILETDEDRASAERAIRGIKGVRGLVDDDLQVNSVRRVRPSDAALEAAAAEAIEWLTTVPKETMKVTARDGWITLEGQVEARHQAECIEEVLRGVPGVRGVKNNLGVQEKQQAA